MAFSPQEPDVGGVGVGVAVGFGVGDVCLLGAGLGAHDGNTVVNHSFWFFVIKD